MIFLRHPVTSAGDGLCYGQFDIGLGAGAQTQIAAALRSTPKCGAIWSSDLSRCRVLAQAISDRDDQPITYDNRLREYHFGAWEAKNWDDIPRSESEWWLEDLWNNSAPGGEAFRQVHDRVAEVLAEVPDDALVVCHAGVIRAAHMILTCRSFDDIVTQQIPFCEPIELSRVRG